MFPLRFSIFSLTGLALAFAQEPIPPGVPIPDATPQPPAGAPGSPAAPDVDLGAIQITEPIVEPKLSGTALAGLYRKYTGRRVIVSAAAATAEFSFVQDASPTDPLSYAQAAELLRKAATIENFVFVPDATDPSLDILTLATGGIRPSSRGVGVYNETDTLPEGDAVISYVMNLDYIKPDEAVRTFTQIIGQFGAYGSIAAVPNAAAVVITENTSLIRRLIDLKKEIDKPSSQVGTRFIPVQYADVTELADTLTSLLTSTQSGQQSAGIQRAPSQPANNPVPIPGAEGTGGSASGEETPVQIVPDARTNRIFVMGRPVDLVFIEGLVREFDTQTTEKNFLRRKLKFLAVSDFLPIAGDALSRAFSGTGDNAGLTQGGQAGGAGGRNQNANRNNANAGGGGFGGSDGNFGGNRGIGSSTSGGGSSGGSVALGDPQINSAPESMLVGRTLLVADNITNSIVVQGPPSGLEIIERLLDQIDVKADQVMISTVFGQLNLDNSTQTGVNWLRAFRGDSNKGLAGSILPGGATTSVLPDDILFPFTGVTAGGFPATSGLSLYGRIGSLGAYVNLLQTDSNFTILSRPSIFTANNQKGLISSGRRIAIPTNSYNNVGSVAGGISTNIEYRDVVLKLEVIPLINSQDEITLQIALLNDEVIGSEPIGDLGDIPIIGTREILTTVTVPNNQTIVLGGLITTNNTKSVTGIPVLSNIPGLGRLFSSVTDGVERSELMIFIQPSIVSGNRSLDYVQADMDSRYQVSSDTRNMADGPGVLPPPDAVPLNDKTAPVPTVIEVETPKAKRAVTRPIHRR